MTRRIVWAREGKDTATLKASLRSSARLDNTYGGKFVTNQVWCALRKRRD